MAEITATKDILWRQQSDEYGVVQVQRVVRITDDEGETSERYWRGAYTPDDDISGLPARMQTLIAAARYPEAVARFEQRKAETPDELPIEG